MLSRHACKSTRFLRPTGTRNLTSSAPTQLPRKKAATTVDGERKQRVAREKPEPQKTRQPKRDAEPKGPPLVGLFAKQARLERALTLRTAQHLGRAASAAARAAAPESPAKDNTSRAVDNPELAVLGSKSHQDLESFLKYAKKAELSTKTAVYKGTLYEYTVASVLKAFGFSLRRTGRSNDLGIDLLGCWHLPQAPAELKVIVQCKASKPTPAMARELEGAYVGAPSAWQGDNVMALLVSTLPCTKGVSMAIQRSTSPVGVMQIDREGRIRQFLWNAVAGERGLSGLGATTKYSRPEKVDETEEVIETITLTWMGKRWRTPSPKATDPLNAAKAAAEG